MPIIHQNPKWKLMIVDPPTGIYYRDDRCQDRSDDMATVAIRPPMNLALLATLAERCGAECFVKDYSLDFRCGDWSQFKKDLVAFAPRILLFNITMPSLKADLLAASIAKDLFKDVITVARGVHFSLYDREILSQYPMLDAVIRGEFEETVAEWFAQKTFEGVRGITYRKEGHIIRNEDRPFIVDMNCIPMPSRKWIDNKRFVRADTGEPEATIRTSKGCPYSCIYCLAGFVSGKKLRVRSPKFVVDEVQECVENYKIKNFLFRSDLFTFHKDWIFDLCDELQARNLNINWACNSRVDTLDSEKLARMKKSGCWAIALGTESGNEESLKKMKKGISLRQSEETVKLCRKAGIKTFTYYLIGFPWETKRHIEDSLNFSVKLNSDLAQFSPLYPFPGTELYEMGKDLGLFKDEDLHPYSLVKPVCGTLHVSKDEIEQYLKKALKAFVFRPRYIARTLLCSGGLRNSFNYVKYGLKVFMNSRRIDRYQTRSVRDKRA